MRVEQCMLGNSSCVMDEREVTQVKVVRGKEMDRFIQAKVLEIAIHNPAITASDLINALLIVDKRIGKNI